MINVLIVDDHAIVREGINKLLSESPEIKIIACLNNGEAAVKFLRENPVHIVLMDMKMPGIGGLEAIRKILLRDPTIKIIAFTTYEADPFAESILAAGAKGYLTKSASVEEMQAAIKIVHAGKRYIMPEIAQNLALKKILKTSETKIKALSPKQLQILIKITNGVTPKAISKHLNLSTKTVNSYRYQLFKKLGVSNDVELLHLALRHHILDPQDIIV